MCKIDPKVRET